MIGIYVLIGMLAITMVMYEFIGWKERRLKVRSRAEQMIKDDPQQPIEYPKGHLRYNSAELFSRLANEAAKRHTKEPTVPKSVLNPLVLHGRCEQSTFDELIKNVDAEVKRIVNGVAALAEKADAVYELVWVWVRIHQYDQDALKWPAYMELTFVFPDKAHPKMVANACIELDPTASGPFWGGCESKTDEGEK